MSIEGHDCWEDCDEGPHGCVCGNDCPPSIRDYTPSIQELARAYEAVFVEARRPEARAEAARAIAAHDAAIAHAAWSEGHTQALVNVAWPDERKSNPYTNNKSEDEK